MKLLQINVCANWGSTGRITEQIGEIAMAQGWESYIAYGRGTAKSTSSLIKIGTSFDVKMHGLKGKFLGMHGLGSVKATKKLIEQIKDINPDIIHLHNIPGYYVNYKLLFEFLREYNKPVVWTLHDCWAFTGRCTHFSFHKCEKWRTGCYDCKFKDVYPNTLFFDRSKEDYKLKKDLFSSNNNLTIVPVSNWLAGLVKESFLGHKPIKVIHNGTDMALFYPHVTKNNKKFVLLGVANQWGERKGFNDFLKLRELLPLNKYDLIMVGVNDNQLKTLPIGIVGIKHTNSVQELAQLYSDADAVVNLSYEETFGMIPVEGFACGTPAIIYNTTGTPELITKETGIICEEGNLKNVVLAIEEIKNNGKEYYSGNCRKHAERYFNKNDKFQEYISLYEKLILK